MGKKGKKKGGKEEQSGDAGPSQGAPQQRAPAHPQQQQQAPAQPQPPRQQEQAPVAQVTAGIAQLPTGQSSQGHGGERHQDDRQQGGRGRGDGSRGRGGGNAGRGRGGPGVGRGQQGQGQTQGGPPPSQGAWGRGAPAQAAQGQQHPPPQRYVPGMGPPPQQGQQQPLPQRHIPGMAPPPQQGQQQPPSQQHVPGMGQALQQGQQQGQGGQGRGGQGWGGRGGRGGSAPAYSGGREPPREQSGSRQSSAPSPASSTASSAAGETASVRSGKASSKPQQAGPGTSPVKTSIPKAEQDRLLSLIPNRKNPNKGGTKGRPITVETNMIPIKFGSNFASSIVHYDVKFEPDRPKFMYRNVMEAVRLKHYPRLNPGYDGRCNLFAAGPLPFGDNLTTEVPVFNRERQLDTTFKVTLARAQDIDTSWLKNVRPGFVESEREQIAIQAVDVVLRSVAIRRQAKTVGRSLFMEPEKGRVFELGNGMDLWIGTFQSVILGWKPYFNVDVAHKGFPKSQPVLDLVKELTGGIQLRDQRDVKRVEEYLRGLKVTYAIPGNSSSKRTWGINGLRRSARDTTFQLDDGTVSTIENYFARTKGYRIQHPDLPTLHVGSRQKDICVPMELCLIEPGQVTNKKMDERQTSTMIKHAATNTATRKAKIMDGFSKMRFNDDPALKEFGISVGNGFETVNARVLDPPSLTDSRLIRVSKGVWRANGFQTTMVLPENSWTILNLNFRTQDNVLYNFVDMLTRSGRNLGMSIGRPTTPFARIDMMRDRDLRQIIAFFQEKKKEGLKLVVVIVPDKTGPEYGKVKQVAELNVGVLTQCLKGVTVERKMNDATAGNILLKINAKLNGTNQIFTQGKLPNCLQSPCMIVGADVTHPSPDSTGIPSIAAVAASYNPNAFRYNVEIRLQPPRTEIILHLQEIMKKQLIFFYRNSGKKPEHIIFYRDGVSEGQFPQVMHHELQAIRNACKALGGASKYEPAITFLVVQKRHHIRMFPTDPKNSDDRNGNVQAGTIVDTDITHPSHIDFYLVSHASIQGTARPTKYRCLWNDNDMSEDEIEQLTYYLCHMFSRCTRSVSYPAPTYYAHLAAFRARALTNQVDIRLNNLEEEQRLKMTIKQEILEGNPMFFV